MPFDAVSLAPPVLRPPVPSEHEVPIYLHGWSVTIAVTRPPSKLRAAISLLGWSPTSKEWVLRKDGGKHSRYTLRGSAWISGRAPNPKSALGRLNTRLHTRLYSLELLFHEADELRISAQGVRWLDLERLLRDQLGLSADEYEIESWRNAERYIVLRPEEAQRLAIDPTNGRGRLARKSYLVRDQQIPVTIRTRTKSVVTHSVYRIRQGATHAYKVEVALKGKTRNRKVFTTEDVAKLDQLLLDLVRKHDLHPLPKPDRWEPALHSPLAQDEALKQVRRSAYAGKAPTECNMVSDLKCYGTVDLTGAYGASARIRNSIQLREGDQDEEDDRVQSHRADGEEVYQDLLDQSREGRGSWIQSQQGGLTFCTYRWEDQPPAQILPPPRPGLDQSDHRGRDGLPQARYRRKLVKPKGPFQRALDEALCYPGLLTELILPADLDPAPLLAALRARVPDPSHLGVGVLAAGSSSSPDTWQSVAQACLQHPVTAQTKVWLLVVDASATAAIVHGREDPNEFLEGGFSETGEPWRQQSQERRILSGYLGEIFRSLRDAVESTDLSVIVVTVDDRPLHAHGPLLPTHRFRDARVRSLVADAGRHYAHLRLRLEQSWTEVPHSSSSWSFENGEAEEACAWTDVVAKLGSLVAVKDEVEGRTGRIVYRPRASSSDALRDDSFASLGFVDGDGHVTNPTPVFVLAGGSTRA